ncbi:MAG: hypothetical protein HZA77_01525 [Candidatus Schekmanbacteria bacterium]|nr:hypothetical protein [Candidatus Schekmanbacteria bacterium]
MKNQITILAPRRLSTWIAPLQGTGIMGLLTLIASIIFHIIKNGGIDIIIIITTIFISPFIIMCFLMICLPQKYISRVLVDKESGTLKLIKKKQVLQEALLSEIKCLKAKYCLFRPASTKYELIIEKYDGSMVSLIKGDELIGGSWLQFCEKVSSIIEKPIEEEYFEENYNGELIKKSPRQLNPIRKKNFAFVVLVLLITLLAAVVYMIYPSGRVFFISGIAAVLTDLSLFFCFIFKSRENLDKLPSNKFILVASTLASVVSLFMLYLSFVFTLMGFKLFVKLLK